MFGKNGLADSDRIMVLRGRKRVSHLSNYCGKFVWSSHMINVICAFLSKIFHHFISADFKCSI